MEFKIKTFKEILDNMANWVQSNSPSVTNFRVGSVIRTMLESVALEIELLYYKMFKGFNIALQESMYDSFSFQRAKSTHAHGHIVITFRGELSQPLIIPKGFQVMTSPMQKESLTFVTTQDTMCPQGVFEAMIQVECTESGPIGNIGPGMITTMNRSFIVMDTVTNIRPMTGGFPEEPHEERKKRFTHFIQTLAKGTMSAVEYGCRSVEGVTGAFVEEGIGFFRVYAHDSNGGLPEELRQRILTTLLDYRSAGIEAQVMPVDVLETDLHVSITLSNEILEEKVEDYTRTIQLAIYEYLSTYSVAQPLLRADLILFIRSISNSLIVNTELDLERDIFVQTNELIRPGEITINAFIG